MSGDFALCVGEPTLPSPPGWRWFKLTDIARLESGHTPSRRHPEYWGGDIPWITLSDARAHDGRAIFDTLENINELGIANSSARLLPAGTVCLSRTASVGYVIVTGRPMATSQDFVNWVCSPKLDPNFLRHLLIAERGSLPRFASGAVHSTIYFPEVKAFHVCIPPLPEQKRIVAILDEAFEGIRIAAANAEKNLANAREIFGAELRRAFEQRSGWRGGALGDLVRFVDYRGKTPPKVDNGVRLITAKNVKMGYIRRDPEEFIDATVYDTWMTRGYPSEGDVLFTTEAPLGNVALLDTTERVVIGQRLITMQPDENVLRRRFLKYLLMSPQTQRKIWARATGATVKGIKAKWLKQIPISYPAPDLQDAITTHLDLVAAESDRLAEFYSARRQVLPLLQQSILTRAFAGELTAATGLAA